MARGNLVPRFGWLSGYGAGDAARDLIAGLILSVLLVPQAMAYAQLAGLPPQMGLYAALLPPLLYLLYGTSRFVSVGPVALVSLIVAEAATGRDGGEATVIAMIIALEAGAMLFLLGALKLGRLVNFVSEPVLLGFTAAAAFLIAFSQLPTLLGIEAGRSGNIVDAVTALYPRLPDLGVGTTLLGLGALALLVLVNRYAAPLLWKAGVHPPYRQAIAKALPLLVMIAAGFAAASFPGPVATVEAVSGGLPSLAAPAGSLALWRSMLPSSIAVAIVIFVTATAAAKSLAGENRSKLDTSREALALGAGNMAAAFAGGYPVGASLSRSALVKESGDASPLASVAASLAVLAVLLAIAPVLAYLPKTALAALVISSVFGLVNLREIRQVWRHDRHEGYIIALAFAGTLLLGVRWGLAFGAGLAVLHYLWFSSLPRVVPVGPDNGGDTYRSVERDDVEIETLPVLILRIDRSLYFGNAAYCEDEIMGQLAEHDSAEFLVLDMRAVNIVDASGLAMLKRVTQRLKMWGIAVHFAALHLPVREALDGLDKTVCHFHETVSDAVSSCNGEHCEAEQGEDNAD